MVYLSQLITVAALSLVGFASGAALEKRADIDVKFFKFSNENCEGEGDEHHLHAPHCKNMDYDFASYYYIEDTSPLKTMFMPWGHHADYHDPRCAVIIYPEADCKGIGWSLGPYSVSPNLPSCQYIGWWAKSVYVGCDEAVRAGWVPEGGNFRLSKEEMLAVQKQAVANLEALGRMGPTPPGADGDGDGDEE